MESSKNNIQGMPSLIEIMDELKKTTSEILETSYENNTLINDAIDLSQKGVFCFDAVIDDNNHENEYIKISSPSAPLHFEELPDSIKSVIRDHYVNVDITATKYLQVTHGY